MERVPEHDKDISHVVHAAFMHILQFFVCRGHEQQASRHQKLNDSSHQRDRIK